MPFPGGKAGAGVYQRIINQIPRHDVYVEACLGDGAVMHRKRPAARNVAVEIDPEVAKSFAAGLSGQDLHIEVYNCCGVEWLKHAFRLYEISSQNPTSSADHAARETPPDLAARAAAAVSSDSPSAPGTAARSSGPSWFVYIDPPYLMSTKRRRLYRYEMTDAQHVELLDVAKRLPCCVAISGYWSPLYAAALQSWRHITFTAMTRGNRLATEYLWMNYATPTELHDYRYLGDEKRERERITRKVRTWAAGLQRLPTHERQAILAALGGHGR